MEISSVLENCEELDKSGNLINIEANVYLPEFIIYGYEGEKGMNLTNYLPSDPTKIVALIKIGEGPNTMDALPDFFSERDLLIRADDGQVIRNGHKVKITGRVIYREDDFSRRCEVRVERIESKSPKEIQTPLEVTTSELNAKGCLKSCSNLAFNKQMVKISGNLVYYDNTAICQMGYCQINFEDSTGSIKVTIVNGTNANSISIDPKVSISLGWKVYNREGREADKKNLTLTGIVYSEIDGCRLMVYTID